MTDELGTGGAAVADRADSLGSVAVTGARGFLGGRVCDRLESAGWTVIELTRAPAAAGSGVREQRRFQLDEPPGAELLVGVDALVHCAYDFAPRTWAEIRAVNVEGSRRVFEAADAAGASRIVTISSMSAFDGCRSMYGRAKLAVERETVARGGAVVRPGLIFGENAGGMVGSLVQVIEGGRIVPVIASASKLYAAHVDDLAVLVERLTDPAGEVPREPVIAAHVQGLTLRQVFDVLARARGKVVQTVPVPWWLVWTALKGAETIGLKPGFRSDSVVSLVHQNPHPDWATTTRAGVAFRPFEPPTALVG